MCSEVPLPSCKSAYSESPTNIKLEILASVLLAITSLGTGCIFSFPSISLPQLTKADSEDIYLSPDCAALFGSLVFAGGALGSACSGPLLVRFGQRQVLLVCLLITLVTWLWHSFSSSILLLLTSRSVLGLMLGVGANAAHTYTLEIAYKNHRGLVYALLPFMQMLGQTTIAILGVLSLSWRTVALICSLVSCLLPFAGLIFIPNSPRWLVTHGRIDEAAKALIFFRGSSYNVTSELEDIISQVDEENNSKIIGYQISHLAKLPNFWLMLTISLLIGFNGSYVMKSYGVNIMQSFTNHAYVAAALVESCKLIGTLVTFSVIEHLGRRPVLIFSYVLCSICLTAFGLYHYVDNFGRKGSAPEWLSYVSIFGFMFFNGLGIAPQCLLRGELMPLSVRSFATSIFMIVIYAGAFSATETYPRIIQDAGEHVAFWIYGGACGVIAMIGFIWLPKTSSRSLEEITSDNITSKKYAQ